MNESALSKLPAVHILEYKYFSRTIKHKPSGVILRFFFFLRRTYAVESKLLALNISGRPALFVFHLALIYLITFNFSGRPLASKVI